MRIPLDWLREFVPVPAEHRAEDVMADLVRVGLEEEDVHRPAAELQGPIVVGQVLSKEPEPQKNGKTINWCSVRWFPRAPPSRSPARASSPPACRASCAAPTTSRSGTRSS